jgi:phosphonate transport system substrate-binding protein
MFRSIPRIALIWALLVAFNSFNAAAFQAQDKFVIAKMSGDPRKTLPKLQALANYLRPILAEAGIKTVDVANLSTVEEMEQALAEGRADLVSETVFAAHKVEQSGLAEIVLREWKGGAAEYRAVFVARRDSSLSSIADIRGRRLMLQDPNSTSGYMLPLLALRRMGMAPVPIDAGAPLPESVRYFSASETKVKDEFIIVSTVVTGGADAGVISNLDWEDPSVNPLLYREQLKIIHNTAPILRQVTLLRRSLAGPVRDKVLKALTEAHLVEAGRAALSAYYKVKKFEAFDAESLAMLEESRRLAALVTQ